MFTRSKTWGRVVLVLLIIACCFQCTAGTNPPPDQIRALLVAAGFRHHIPPQILFAVAFSESGWQQFNADGSTHLNLNDGGIGIMQITGATGAPFNHDSLMTSTEYNIEAGATVLEGKWGGTPIIGDGNGAVGREKLENWYYAVWAYNSWGYINNPNNRNTPPPYTAKSTVYQDTVYSYLKQPPSSLAGLWQAVDIHAPSNAEIGSITTGGVVGCGQRIANTPSPYHVDANFDGIIDGTEGGGGSDTDIWVDGGYSGAQNGTQANPYSTVKAAVDRASATQAVTIHIKPGTYSEKISTSRHIHFVTSGSGTVHIGG